VATLDTRNFSLIKGRSLGEAIKGVTINPAPCGDALGFRTGRARSYLARMRTCVHTVRGKNVWKKDLDGTMKETA
jgi:hypothetical protein